MTTDDVYRKERLRAHGGIVVPQCAYVVGRVVAEILRKATP